MEQKVLNPNHEKRDSEPVAQRRWAIKRKTRARRYTQITGGDVLPTTVRSFACCRATPWPVLGHCIYVRAPARSRRPAQKENAR